MGAFQPALDDFAAAAMADILKKRKPELALAHLTAYDMLRHRHGDDPGALRPAYESLDRNFGRLLAAAAPDAMVIAFTDHAQLDVGAVVNPNLLLQALGYLRLRPDESVEGGARYFFENCGGAAFLHAPGERPGGAGAGSDRARIREAAAGQECFGRFLTDEEMRGCGRGGLPFGFGAKPGYCFDFSYKKEKANHGYPADYAGYEVFWAARGPGREPGVRRGEGSLLDIAPMAAAALGLEGFPA